MTGTLRRRVESFAEKERLGSSDEDSWVSQRGRLRSLAPWAVLTVVAVASLLVVAPFLLLVTNSLKTEVAYNRGGPLAWPRSITFSSWSEYIHQTDYFRLLVNSVLISGLVAVVGVTVSLLAGYALGIGRVRGNRALVAVLLFGTMVPQEALLYPLFDGAVTFHLTNTILSVVIIFAALYGAFGTYLMASMFGTFPRSLLEAAMLDGASRWQVLRRVVLPIAKPMLGVLLVFFFVWSWNEFLIPLVMLTSPSVQTVPIALATMQGQEVINVTELNAGSLLSLLPTLVFFIVFQRTLVRGISAGAVK